MSRVAFRASLAPYAADAARSPGRAFPETRSPLRGEFQRDRDRILHASAFRRLALKTQVMLPEDGDHHRTRLTHTLEVAQVARSLARSLGFDEDLTEALALAHDLGHAPFGHTGEDALAASAAAWGGFDHNVQSLRIVADLEQRYLGFDGLNLMWDTLEGLAKRNGPVSPVPDLLRAYDTRFDLRLDAFPSGEAQVAAIADDIAYNAHDIEDGLRAGLLALDEVATVPFIAALLDDIGVRSGVRDGGRLPFELARRSIDRFVVDAVDESGRRLARAAPVSVAALRGLDHSVVASSPAFMAASRDIKTFLFARLYRHPKLVAVRARAGRVVAAITDRFLADPDLLPDGWAGDAAACGGDAAARARVVIDYVAGMTDRFALREHRRLFGNDGGFDPSSG